MEHEPDAGDNLDHLVALMTDDISLEQDQLETMKEALDNRPRNTLKSYESKQKEFVAWMHSKNFLDGITITGAKVHSFLRSVINRPNKRKSSCTIGSSSLKSYGASCIDLYKRQRYLNSNSNPHPRDNPAVKQLFETVRAQTYARKRQNFDDRGAVTIKDGYTTSQELSRIFNYFMG